MSGKSGLSALEAWISRKVELKKQAMEMDARTKNEDDGTEGYTEGSRAKENKSDVVSQSTAEPVDTASKPTEHSPSTGATKPENAPDSGLCDENTETQGSGIATEQADGAIAEPPAEDSMEKDSAASLLNASNNILKMLSKTASQQPQQQRKQDKQPQATREEYLKKQAALDNVVGTFQASGAISADAVVEYLAGFAKSAMGDIDEAAMAELAGGAPGEEEALMAAAAPEEAAMDPVDALAGAGGMEEMPSEEELEELAEVLADAGITPEDLLAAVEGVDVGGLEPTAALKKKRACVLDRVIKRASNARAKIK